jgi:hypothetical protein
MALRAEIVDLVRADLFEHAVEITGIGQIAVMKEEALAVDRGVLEQVINAASIEAARRRIMPWTV